MKRLFRGLLGLTVLLSLIPALAIPIPEVFENLALGGTGEGSPADGDSADALEATGSDSSTPSESASNMKHANTENHAARPGSEVSSSTSAATIGSSSSLVRRDSTTSEQHATSSSTPATHPGGVISGNSCPCSITGTVTLKGHIELKGDLVVDGGHLVARSGVEVHGNGHQIMLMNGATADIQGTPTSTWSGSGANTNVARDINFRNLQRIMFHGGAGTSVLKYFAVFDSGTPALGDYPLHWHLNGDTTRGTLVEGVAVVNGANHAFVPHGSHGITFKDTIAKNITGSAYWWDPEGTNGPSIDNSNDIVFDHVLADDVHLAHGAKGYHRVAGFVLGDGAENVLRNSAAINISGGADCSGFHWPEKAESTWTFRNNYSMSQDCHGIFVWQNNVNTHVIDEFNGGGISQGAYRNSYEYAHVDVAYFVLHAAGITVRDSLIGTVIAQQHRNTAQPTGVFENVTIEHFIVANADNSGEVPGMYVLTNTGLECGDIEYQKVVPGTQVIIDGSKC